MYIYSCQISEKKRIPILCYCSSSFPILVPFLYVTLKRQYKSYNTIRNDLVAIKAMYEFHASLGRDLDEMLIAGRFSILTDSLEQFVAWLSTSRSATNIVGRIGISTGDMDPGTRDNYLRSLKLFFVWCAQRYIGQESGVRNELDAIFSDLADTIALRFDALLLTAASRQIKYRSLTEFEVELLRSACYPTSPTNPFRLQNRLRNWLMFEVLQETGIRLGELLLLTTTDIAMGSGRCYLTITNHDDAGRDTRATRPSIKTIQSHRTISISQALFDNIQDYIRHERRPVREGKPLKLAHRYIWVSDRGHPLAANTASHIVQQVVEAARAVDNTRLPHITPHSFRYTFAERFLGYLLDVKGLDMERAKDELRTICGWSESSIMPQHYARKYIHNLANQHNMDRVNSAWERARSALSTSKK
jgi:integrase